MSDERLALDPELIPDMKRSSLPSGSLTFEQYVQLRADYELAAAFASLLWPEFVEIDGCILLKDRFDPSNFEEWKGHYKGDCPSIEAMVNHLHVWDLCPNAESDHLDDAVFEFIGRVIQKCWSHAVDEAFPDRVFTVEYNDERDDPNEYGPTVYLYQSESDSSAGKG